MKTNRSPDGKVSVVFHVDRAAYAILAQQCIDGNYKDIGEIINEALALHYTVRKWQAVGFRRIFLVEDDSEHSREIVLPIRPAKEAK